MDLFCEKIIREVIYPVKNIASVYQLELFQIYLSVLYKYIITFILSSILACEKSFNFLKSFQIE